MKDESLAHAASVISMKESDTCNSLETIPQLSTHRASEHKENIDQNFGGANKKMLTSKGLLCADDGEDELLKELINFGSDPVAEEAADNSLLLLANEWEQQ